MAAIQHADFSETLLRFSDSLIASTSSQSGQVCVWETQHWPPWSPLNPKSSSSARTRFKPPPRALSSAHTSKRRLWRRGGGTRQANRSSKVRPKRNYPSCERAATSKRKRCSFAALKRAKFSSTSWPQATLSLKYRMRTTWPSMIWRYPMQAMRHAKPI